MKKKVDKKGIISAQSRTPEEWISLAATAFSIFLIMLGVFGLYLVQTSIRNPQDLRQQASVDQGQVAVTVTGPSSMDVNSYQTLGIEANTNGLQTDGVQLFFNVVTDTLDEPPVVTPVEGAGLQVAYLEVQDAADGYLVGLIAIPANIGSTFSTTSPREIFSLNFTPVRSGSIELNFDRELSISTAHGTNPPQDELTHINSYTFQVAGAASPTPTPSPSPTPTPSPEESPIASPELSPSPSPVFTPTPSPLTSPSPDTSPTSDPTPTPTPTPTSDPGTGGPTVKSCNESCSSNSECETNYRCYDGRCRLATNVSSSSCEDMPDQGLNRSCNEYCANTGECASGYTCWENRCRNPLNVTSTSCDQLTTTQYQLYVSSCNQSCYDNNDCATNLRCYQGACRLASNVSSLTCSPAETTTVSYIYEQPKTSPTPKGGDFLTQTSTTSASASPRSSASPTGGIGSTTSPRPSPSAPTYTDTSSDISDNETALQAVVRNLQDRGISFPLAMIGSGVFLIFLILLLLSLSRKKPSSRSSASRPPIYTPPPSQLSGIQQRIDTLKKPEPPKPGSTMTNPPAGAPVPPMPTPPTKPGNLARRPDGSSMVDRLKEKGTVFPQNLPQNKPGTPPPLPKPPTGPR